MIYCPACELRTCPVHLGIATPPPLMQVHWAGCSAPDCTGCLPPQWTEWDRQAQAAAQQERS